MKIVGTKDEIELLLSALPGASGNNLIPPPGWIVSYMGMPIEIEIVSSGVEPVRHGRSYVKVIRRPIKD